VSRAGSRLAVLVCIAVVPSVAVARAGDRSEEWVTVAIGGEYRVRTEYLDALDFGISGAPAYTSIAQRELIHVDLHTRSRARMLVELSAAQERGRRPAARSFDASRPDLAQAFIALPLDRASETATLQIGRQALDLSGNRLVSLRDGVTLKRAFDAARVDVGGAALRATVFAGRVVANKPGAFDDGADAHESFAGAVVRSRADAQAPEWSLFYFDRQRDRAHVQQASGQERRETLGVRYVRMTAEGDVAVQGALQTGRLVRNAVRAGGIAVDVGWRVGPSNATRIGVSVGAASGDRDPHDHTINTFDPLYPSLGAFSDAPLWYPANQLALGINASRAVGRATWRASSVLLARSSLADALYANPGRPLATPDDEKRLGAWLFELSLRWQMTDRVELYASCVHAAALEALAAVGGNSAEFALLQLTGKF
jgi:hypothetical protein